MLRTLMLMSVVMGALPLAPQFEDGGEHHYVQGPGGAASVSLTARPVGRLVVGFPSGNSGAGLWLVKPLAPGGWKLEAPPELVTATPGRHAVKGVIVTKEAALELRAPLGGSLRFLRAYDRESSSDARRLLGNVVEALDRTPQVIRPEDMAGWLQPKVAAQERSIAYTWGALAGGVGNALTVSVWAGGTIVRASDGGLTIRPGPAGRIAFVAECAHAPLKPWPEDQVYDAAAIAKLEALEARDPVRGKRLREGLGRLRFLIYRDKLLAGSWRYLTYFGRDTLLTLRMLMPVFTPPVIEGALDSVLARLSPEGKVAHEEDLGDQAALDRAIAALNGRSEPGAVGDPVYDYKMVDSDFLLPIALAEYVADPRVGKERAARFLKANDRAAKVRVNAESVLSQASPYTDDPRPTKLVALVAGSDVGDWRDSLDGLARGRYAFSLNAVLIPQSLGAIRELLAAGLLGTDFSGQPTLAAVAKDPARLEKMRAVWAGARAHFIVRRSANDIAKEAARYLAEGPLEPAEKAVFERALEGHAGDLELPAVALDAQGTPIPVMCSDDVLGLFGPPLPPGGLPERVRPLVTPFPAGLFSDAGLFVASPALSGSIDLWTRFSRRHYHGTVVWAWPMAMAEMGLTRQLRSLGKGGAREELERARSKLKAARLKLEARGLGELWAFHVEGGALAPYPFGASANDTTESNALQLWSAAWLALALED